MAGIEDGISQAVGSIMPSANFTGYILIVLFVLTLFIPLLWFIFVLEARMRIYTTTCFIWVKTRYGWITRTARGGKVRDIDGKLKFRLLKPAVWIESYDDSLTLQLNKKGRLAGFVQTSDDLYEQTDVQITDKKGRDVTRKRKVGNISQLEYYLPAEMVKFSPRKVGRGLFFKKYRDSVSARWDLKSWFEKHGLVVALGWIAMLLIACSIFLLQVVQKL